MPTSSLLALVLSDCTMLAVLAHINACVLNGPAPSPNPLCPLTLPAKMFGPTTVALLPLVDVKVAVPRVRLTPAAVGAWRLQGSREQHETWSKCDTEWLAARQQGRALCCWLPAKVHCATLASHAQALLATAGGVLHITQGSDLWHDLFLVNSTINCCAVVQLQPVTMTAHAMRSLTSCVGALYT
jgi:hypothetical protein